jgi:hypothetical protein
VETYGKTWMFWFSTLGFGGTVQIRKNSIKNKNISFEINV